MLKEADLFRITFTVTINMVCAGFSLEYLNKNCHKDAFAIQVQTIFSAKLVLLYVQCLLQNNFSYHASCLSCFLDSSLRSSGHLPEGTDVILYCIDF